MTEFDRANPLWERDGVPFDIVTTSSAGATKKRGRFTVRILRGRRQKGDGDGERVIRFEMSDECQLLGARADAWTAGDDAPGNAGASADAAPWQRTPHAPVIHAPFLTRDRGRGGLPAMLPKYRHTHDPSSVTGSLALKPVSNCQIELYELEVGESDFANLRRDQALLVDFNDFANSLISLLQLCDLGGNTSDTSASQEEHNFSQVPSYSAGDRSQPHNDFSTGTSWQTDHPTGCWHTPSQTQPRTPLNHPRHGTYHHGLEVSTPYANANLAAPASTYACRLETDAPTSRRITGHPEAAPHARFSVVESNQFRELTHLALNLNVGTDKTVRTYLSARMSQIVMENKNIQFLRDEQRRRTEAAEADVVELNKRLRELGQAAQEEKSQIRHQAEERFQTENRSRLTEVNEVKAAKDAEVSALKESHRRKEALLENKIRVLEEVNAKINVAKMAGEQENDRLGNKLSFQETTNNALTNELSALRDQFNSVTQEKATAEKTRHELQLRLSALEHAHDGQERSAAQTEAQRAAAEKASAEARQTMERQWSQMEELRRRAEEAERETKRYQDLTARYQVDRLEMKRRMKEKMEALGRQEDALRARDEATAELKCRSQKLEEAVQRMHAEKGAVTQEVRDLREQVEMDKKKLDNNQQVIAWLNKQVNEPVNGGGAVWRQGERTADGAGAGAYPAACPTPADVDDHVSSLSGYMHRARLAARAVPSGRCPADDHDRGAYVTPEIGKMQLPPEPTPYSRVPHHPDATKR